MHLRHRIRVAEQVRLLHSQEGVQAQHRHSRESEHAAEVNAPRLLGFGVDPGQPVDDPLGRQVLVALEHPRQIVAERPVRQGQRDRQRDKEDDSSGGGSH